MSVVDRPAHPPFSVQERDVDLLILEQLHVSPPFVAWIGERAGIAGARLASARHSVYAERGETDVLAILEEASGRVALMIEDILLQQMARHLAKANKLDRVMADVVALPCRWDMFEERLRPASGHSMNRAFAGASPAGGAVYFEEMAPFPSVPLVRIPLLTRPATLGLMPNEPLSVRDLRENEARAALMFATGISPVDARLPTLGLPPEDRIERVEGQIILYREVRLALAPIDRHGWGAVLEFRPFLGVDLPEDGDQTLCYGVANAVEPDLARLHFYPQQEDGRLVWPTIERDGEIFRVACLNAHDEVLDRFGKLQALWAEELLAPVESPFGRLEPWYLTYAALDAVEVRHWLAPNAPLAEDGFSQPWSRLFHPPERELLFGPSEPAARVECCLHNGLLEQALQAMIDRLVEGVATLRSELSAAREAHAQRLLNRWCDVTP